MAGRLCIYLDTRQSLYRERSSTFFCPCLRNEVKLLSPCTYRHPSVIWSVFSGFGVQPGKQEGSEKTELGLKCTLTPPPPVNHITGVRGLSVAPPAPLGVGLMCRPTRIARWDRGASHF
jgi:hypothetical protein